jgi:hypothetical protein
MCPFVSILWLVVRLQRGCHRRLPGLLWAPGFTAPASSGIFSLCLGFLTWKRERATEYLGQGDAR